MSKYNKDIRFHGCSFEDFMKEEIDEYGEMKVYKTKKRYFGENAYFYVERELKVIYYIINWYFSHPDNAVFFMSSERIEKNMNKLGCKITLKGVQYGIRCGIKEGILIASDNEQKELNGLNHTRELRVNWKLVYELLGIASEKDSKFSQLKAKSRLKKFIRKRPFTSQSELRKTFSRLMAEKKSKARTIDSLFKAYLLKVSAKYYSTESYTEVSDNPEQIAYLARQAKKKYELRLDKEKQKIIIHNYNDPRLSEADRWEFRRFGFITPGNAFIFHIRAITNIKDVLMNLRTEAKKIA